MNCDRKVIPRKSALIIALYDTLKTYYGKNGHAFDFALILC